MFGTLLMKARDVQITANGRMTIKLRKAGKGKAIPGQALRIPGGWGTQISIQSVHESGKVVSPKYWPPLTPRKYSLVLISVTG